MAILGELTACVAKVLLSMLQLYVARGNALLRSDEEKTRRCVLRLIIVGTFLISLGCEAYGRYYSNLDWSTTLYFYESWPGMIVLTLNLLLFFEVCRSTRILFKKPETSRAILRFYRNTFFGAILF